MLTVKLLAAVNKATGSDDRLEGMYIDISKGFCYVTNRVLLVRVAINGKRSQSKKAFRFVPLEYLKEIAKKEKPGTVIQFDAKNNQLIAGASRFNMYDPDPKLPESFLASFEKFLTPTEKDQEFGFYAPQYLNLIESILKAAGAGSLNRISNSIKIDWVAIPGGRRGPLVVDTASHGITAALMPMAV